MEPTDADSDGGSGQGRSSPGEAGRRGSEMGELSEWERRRRRAAVFGEVLPDTTRDERDEAGDGRGSIPGSTRESRDEDWLKAQVPPHHGG